jgi:TPR repeat protein
VSLETDWSILENVRAEWPTDDFEPEADLAAWRQGMRLYDERDDYAGMIESGRLMSRALRHHLYGRELLAGADLPETTHRVLFSSCFPPPDQQSFPQSVQAQVRLGLMIVKKNGWQQVAYGGDDKMAPFLKASTMVLTMAIAPSPERVWEGDLRGFFTTNPVEIADDPAPPRVADPGAPPPTEADGKLIDDLYEMVKASERGDPAATARIRGLQAVDRGDHTEALREFESAAQMGDVGAMYDAGNAAEDLGRPAQAQYWFEAAADRGHPGAAYNAAVAALGTGDTATARSRFEQATENGSIEGYAALTQLADETGDRAAEIRWSRLGAERGQPFCQVRQAQLLMQDHPQDVAVILNQAVPLLKLAAERGQGSASFLLGIAYGQIGDNSEARLWLKRAEAEGDAEATRVMRAHGLE